MDSQHEHLQTCVDTNTGLALSGDQFPDEETGQRNLSLTPEGGDRGTRYSKQKLASSSSAASSSSSSPPQDFSFTDRDRTNGISSLLLSAEMTPADEIFFYGHLLPLHLLSHLPSLSSPWLSTDYLDSFTLPVEECSLDDDESTSTDESSRNSSTESNFNGKCGNRIQIHSETNPHASPSDIHGMGDKLKPLSLFGLPRRRGASKARGYEDNQERQKRSFRFELNRAVKRYLRMARPLLRSFRRRKREVNIELHDQTLVLGDSRGTETFSAPSSVTTSPRNSGPLAEIPAVSAAVTDSTVEELQAAIQAAIAYCKKSIAVEETEEKLQT